MLGLEKRLADDMLVSDVQGLEASNEDAKVVSCHETPSRLCDVPNSSVQVED